MNLTLPPSRITPLATAIATEAVVNNSPFIVVLVVAVVLVVVVVGVGVGVLACSSAFSMFSRTFTQNGKLGALFVS